MREAKFREHREVWAAGKRGTEGQTYLGLKDLLVDFPAGDLGHLPH